MGEPDSEQFDGRVLGLVAALPALVAALVGIATFGGSFVFDDYFAIEHNPFVQGEVALGEVVRRDFWGTPLDEGARSFRPVVSLLWRALVSMGGAPWMFRAVSLVGHATVTELTRRWVADRTRSSIAGVVAALVFAAHPVLAEAIASNVGQADVLGVALGLGAMLAGTKTWARALVAAALLALSGLCKETFVVFAVVVALEGWIDAERPADWLRLVPMLVVTAVLVGLHLSIDRSRALDPTNNLGLAATDPGTHLAWAGAIIGRGALMTLVPWGRSPVHDYASATLDIDVLMPLAVCGAAVALALVGLAVWALFDVERRRIPAVGSVLLLAPLVLASNLLFDTLTGLAERLLYLPMLGTIIIATWFASSWLMSFDRRTAPHRSATPLAVLVVVVVAVELAAAWPMLRAWRSPLALWRHAVVVTPGSMRAHANLGAALLNEGAVEAGIVELAIGRAIAESYPAPVDPSRWSALRAMPIERAVVAAPERLVGAHRACEFASRVLGDLATSRPDVAQRLAPVWAQVHCAGAAQSDPPT